MSIAQAAAVILAVVIFFVIVKYAGGVKAVVLGLLFSAGLGLISYWIVDFIVRLPSYVILIFMLAWLTFNVMYNKAKD